MVRGQQVGGFRVGAGQHDGGHAHDVSGETRRDEFFASLLRGHQDFAAHVAAFFNRRQLVFKVHACRTSSDHVFHQLERVQDTAETGFCVGDDGQEVVDELFVAGVDATAPLNFIGAFEGVVDAANHGGHRVVGVQRLVGVHGFRGVAVGGDLPARQVHGFQTGLGLLHGLARTDGTKGVHIAFFRAAVHFFPELLGTAFGQGVLDGHAAAQTHHIGGAVTALDALPSRVGGPIFFQLGNLLFAAQG